MTDDIVGKRKRSPSEWLSLCAFFFGAFPALFVAMALVGRVALIAELSTHFFIQYFWALLFAIIGFILLRRWKLVAIFAVFWIVCVIKLLPFYIAPMVQIPANASQLTIVNSNVNTRNENFDAVASYVLMSNPDIAVFQETSDEWVQQLVSMLKSRYPYWTASPRDDNFGIAIFSKHPFQSSTIENFGNVQLPSVVSHINVHGKRITIIGTHTYPPMDENMLRVRTQQINGIVSRRKDFGECYLVAGDLNCSSWSPYFDDLTNGLGLTDSRMGRGVQPSWPVGLPLLATPIDHILASDAFVTVERKLGPNVGSDHYPVFARFAIVK